MRQGFKESLLKLGREEEFLVLTGDHGYALFDEFRSAFPGQFFNVGVAESNLVGVAAGLARAGYQPLIYGLASFIPNRVYEFIKLQIALDGLPVTVIGDGGGLVYSTLGHSHQSLDDLALAGSLPNFSVFSPASDDETSAILLDPARRTSPRYIRLGKSDGAYKGGFPAKTGDPYLVSRGKEKSIGIVSHGAMTSRVLELKMNGHIPDYDLWTYASLSQPKIEWRDEIAAYKKIVVVEEHIEHGGLFSILASAFSDSNIQLVPVCATKDFHHGVGEYEWALESHGLGNSALIAKLSTL